MCHNDSSQDCPCDPEPLALIPATQLEDLPIRVGLGQFQVPTDSLLAYIKQCGVDDIQMNTATLPGDSRWEYEDLAALRERLSLIHI